MKKWFSFLLVFMFMLSIWPVALANSDEDSLLGDLFSAFGDLEENDGSILTGGENAMVSLSTIENDTDLDSPTYAVSGEYTWFVVEGMIICVKTESGEEEAAYPLADLYKQNELAVFASLAAWREEKVLLYLGVYDENSKLRVSRFVMSQNDNEIIPEENRDVTGDFGLLFDDSSEWDEIGIVFWGTNLFVEVFASDSMVRFYHYVPETGSVTLFGALSQEEYIAGIPCSDYLLLVSSDPDDENRMEIIQLSPESGNKELLGTVDVSSARSACNFAYSESENKLYFTIYCVAYALPLGGEEKLLKIFEFPVQPKEYRLSSIVGNQYLVWGDTVNGKPNGW